MAVNRRVKDGQKRREMRTRSRIKRNLSVPRVSVFRSLSNIYAQVIDDSLQKTVASCSSLEIKAKGDKKAVAHAVGIELAKRALAQGVEKAVFDRGRFLYHGRVAALADGLREGKLQI
jgi:large subunit ribosomal protein L18